MRKSISIVNESKITNYCTRADKLLKDINNAAENKLRLIRADDEMGDIDKTKLGKLDDFILSLDKALKALLDI